MIAEKYIHNIAVGYFISGLIGDHEQAHAISHILMDEGPEFTHNFNASLYFLIHRFRNFIIEQNSGFDNVIDELCIKLTQGKINDADDVYKSTGCLADTADNSVVKNNIKIDDFFLHDPDDEDQLGR